MMKKLSFIGLIMGIFFFSLMSSCKSDDDNSHTVSGKIIDNNACGYLIQTANGNLRPNNLSSEFEQTNMLVKVHYEDLFRDVDCSGGKARVVSIISIQQGQ